MIKVPVAKLINWELSKILKWCLTTLQQMSQNYKAQGQILHEDQCLASTLKL